MGTFHDGRKNPKRKVRRQPLIPAKSERRLRDQKEVIAFWQLRKDGLATDDIARLVDAKVLISLPGRVLTTCHGELTHEAMRWAAIVGCGPRARLAGPSVLGLLDIRENDAAPFHVVVTGQAPRKRPGVHVHRSTALPNDDFATHLGYPATTVARALVDAASSSSAETLAADLDRAVMLGRYDAVALELAMKARPMVRGRLGLDEAIASLDASTGKFRSAFERRTMRLVKQSKVLPTAIVNVLVTNYRPDFLFIGTSAIVECDGRGYHRSPAQIIADAEREERLLAMGYSILRLRWADVTYRPEETLLRIERFVREHSAPPIPKVC